MKGLNCEQARSIDIIDYLLKYDHEPTLVRGKNYWYLSPLRKERTPSFKVNRKINRWYDHGIGKGGNLVDFALLFHHCSLREWLQNLDNSFLPARQYLPTHEPSKKLAVEATFPLQSPALFHYLEQRNISLSAALEFCCEIRYRFNEKIYSGIGFKNDLGGYEIRNAFYKNSSSPKSITTIKNGAENVLVFEGFFDFLSFISCSQNRLGKNSNFCVLNSLSFFERARPSLEQHRHIYLYLDNDPAGQKCTRQAINLSPQYLDQSTLYKGFKDLNVWWQTQKASPCHRSLHRAPVHRSPHRTPVHRTSPRSAPP